MIQEIKDTVLSKSPNVLSTEAGGEVALMSLANGCYYALNSVASDIWRRLEQPVNLGQLTAALVAEYNGDPAGIAQDLRDTVDQWASWNLVVLS